MRTFYSFFWYIILPFICLRLLILSLKNRAYLARVWQRFGFVPQASTNDRYIWIHAVSVGEVMATQSIVKNLKSELPDYKIIITTGTPTGADTVYRLYGDSVIHYYQPYDAALIIKRFIKQINPQLLLVMETELWPNLFYYCKKLSIPVLLINARLSNRSSARYQYFSSLTHPMMSTVKAITAQTELDKQNLIDIGANEKSISVTGSIKFDIELDEQLKLSASNYKQQNFYEREIWIAASTHKPEEEMVLDVHTSLIKQFPDSLLIIVPRHSVRKNEIVDILKVREIKFQLSSQSLDIKSDTQVLLVDTMGELLFFYGVSDIAFIGGSLIPHGGHNPIEAAAFSIPILIGKHDFNFSEIDANLIKKNGAIRVNDVNDLQDTLIDIFNDTDKQTQIGRNAFDYVQESQGSSKKVWNIIKSFIH